MAILMTGARLSVLFRALARGLLLVGSLLVMSRLLLLMSGLLLAMAGLLLIVSGVFFVVSGLLLIARGLLFIMCSLLFIAGGLLLTVFLLRPLFTRHLLLLILALILLDPLLLRLCLLLLVRGFLLTSGLVALCGVVALIHLTLLDRGPLQVLAVSFVLGAHHGSAVIGLGVIRPVAVLTNPVGMIGGDPARVLVVPPLPVMPVVLLVVRAVSVAPFGIP